MDEETLLQYEDSLKELEKQRESLELVMKRMGVEWEESGAGIGWMGDLSSTTTTHYNNNIPTPLLKMIQSGQQPNQGPSHDYLQTLLHVNEELLAESLASNQYNEQPEEEELPRITKIVPPQQQSIITPPLSIDEINDTTTTINHNTSQQVLNQLTSPPITPNDEY